MTKSIVIPDTVIVNKIYLLRGKKVMLDRDLAEKTNRIKRTGKAKCRPLS
jgi:hypothetical protein